MVFSSLPFLIFFLPITVGLYFIVPKTLKNPLLLTTSILFYAWGEPKYVILILLSVTLNYFLALLMAPCRGWSRKMFLFLTLALNLGLLGYFKYFNFFGSTLNRLFGRAIISEKDISLPIGISFYTFQVLSYGIDLYREKIRAQRSWEKLALYISFFPQLIAGPIVQYGDIEAQLAHHPTDTEKMANGLRRFCMGLGKKTLIANMLALPADRIYGLPPQQVGTALTWAAAICYMLQIYYDFSAYSDMAIGLAECFGFHFRENFIFPYTASSVQEFWRKWHISLSSWFRDYLYIPLGGNRRGRFRTYLNLSIVFFLTGLWHGAGLHFIFWGVFHGCFSIFERLLPRQLRELFQRPAFRPVTTGYTLLEVMIGWIFFRVPGLKLSFEYISKLFTFRPEPLWDLREIILPQTIFLLIIAILFSGWVQRFVYQKLHVSDSTQKIVTTIWSILVLLLSLMQLVSNTYNPFIYFRF